MLNFFFNSSVQRIILYFSLFMLLSISVIPVRIFANTSLNLKNASLRSFISTVSRATGKNFLIDPRVKGSVTVIISTPLDSKALYQVFLSILKVHNFIAVEGEYLTKILPGNQSKTNSAYVSSLNPDSLITTIIPSTISVLNKLFPY